MILQKAYLRTKKESSTAYKPQKKFNTLNDKDLFVNMVSFLQGRRSIYDEEQ